MRLTEEEQAQLSVKRATVTPLWKGLFTLIKYRTSRNYRNPEFLGPRIGDKLIFSLLISTLYLGIGDDLVETNYLNIGAVLFMWSTLPACAPDSLRITSADRCLSRRYFLGIHPCESFTNLRLRGFRGPLR